MLLRIARHEVRDVLRDGRFRLAAVMILGLLSVALVTGWSYHRAVAAQHASAAETSRRTWLSQSARDPHSAAHYGAYVFKPRDPLALIDSGLHAYTGVAAWLEAHKQNEFQFRPAQDRASVARLGQLTAAVTLQTLVPIVIILLAFTKFAGERENGTLRHVVATGVAPGRLALGKAIGIAGALALIAFPAVVIGSVALLWTSGLAAMAESGGRLAALILVYGLYLTAFVGIALAASSWARRAATALAILLGFWAINVVVAPRLAADVSRAWYPTPTAFEFQQSVHHDSYDGLTVHDYNVRRAADLRARLLAQHQVSRIEDLPVNFRGVDYLEREARSDAIWTAHYADLWNAFERQIRVHQAAGLAAPLMSVRALSMALTGADFFHHQHFARAAEEYRRRMVLAMNTDLAYSGSSAKRGAYTADPALWATVEPFRYDAPGVWAALSQARVAAVTLGGWLVIGGIALALSVRRLRVE
jgi:ABC-2 type transport system permease protein